VAGANKQRVAQLQRRLAASREQWVALALALQGGARGRRDAAPGPGAPAAFPRSRIMRALLGRSGWGLLGAAALALSLLRPQLLGGVTRLQPLLMRYLLPRLLGER